jgi:hypothetical protein
MNWVVIVREGVIGVGVWFGAPIRHRMSGRSLASHRHGGCEHVHLRSQCGIVWSSDLLLLMSTLVSM